MQQGRKEHRRPAYISGSKTVRGAIMKGAICFASKAPLKRRPKIAAWIPAMPQKPTKDLSSTSRQQIEGGAAQRRVSRRFTRLREET